MEMKAVSKKIVVYFSYTGNTKKIAEQMKGRLHCDTLEVKTVVPYSDNYDAVVNDEHNSQRSNFLPELQKIGVDLKDYDKIILGTPVWWYRPVPAIRAFLSQNDLSGKTIYPFATNAGWLGKTFEEIKVLCPTAIVKNGLNIKFKSYSDQLITKQADIDRWIAGIE